VLLYDSNQFAGTKLTFGVRPDLDLPAYWKWATYQADIRRPHGWHFNSNQAQLMTVTPGDRVWRVTGKVEGNRTLFALLSSLHVDRAESAVPGLNDYGKSYRVWGDPDTSFDFDPNGQDMAPPLLQLEFFPPRPIADEQKIAQSLQSIRYLSGNDSELLETYSATLKAMELATFRGRTPTR
jgi:hypothetical protein